MPVLVFPKRRASREQAIAWLRQHHWSFPSESELGERKISDEKYCSWRFVLGLDRIIYFANCIEPGITELQAFPHKTVGVA